MVLPKLFLDAPNLSTGFIARRDVNFDDDLSSLLNGPASDSPDGSLPVSVTCVCIRRSYLFALLWLIQIVEFFGVDQDSGQKVPSFMVDDLGVLRPSRPCVIEYSVPSSS